jgi:membrane peptidoglycan carboxypeptidase
VTSLPPWALVGAELQDPKTGEIVAEYPGKGQNLTTAQCDGTCMLNTAQDRQPVGSSFKPYVLATALTQKMNVQSSKLNTSPYLCVLPDSESSNFSVPITSATYNLSGTSSGCPVNTAFKVNNDGGEIIGKQVGQQPTGPNKGATYYSDNVQDALAQSSNTGFTDLAHRVGTTSIVKIAQAFGVDTANYPSGSGLAHDEGQVGMALGINALTVQEQATMLSTIANNGEYHAAHLVKYWQTSSDAAKQEPKVDQHMVLTPQQAQDEQYAMEKTTIDGTAAGSVTYGQQNLGMVIGKTGTTTGSKEGFFIGATTQYSLVVGMFTPSTSDPHSLEALGGGGFGGYWPAKIWNSFAETEFSPAAQAFPTTPSGEGTPWNMLGTVPKAKPVCSKKVHGHKVAVAGKGCPNPSQQNCQQDTFGNQTCNGNGNGNNQQCQNQNDPNCSGNPTPTSTCDPNNDPNCSGNPTPTSTCDPNNDPNCSGNPTPTSTCDPNNDPNCSGGGGGGGGGGGRNNSNSVTAPDPQAGLAVGGGLLILPGSFVWTVVSRRRRRGKHAGTAE